MFQLCVIGQRIRAYGKLPELLAAAPDCLANVHHLITHELQKPVLGSKFAEQRQANARSNGGLQIGPQPVFLVTGQQMNMASDVGKDIGGCRQLICFSAHGGGSDLMKPFQPIQALDIA
jgi:hypothetical protein